MISSFSELVVVVAFCGLAFNGLMWLPITIKFIKNFIEVKDDEC